MKRNSLKHIKPLPIFNRLLIILSFIFIGNCFAEEKIHSLFNELLSPIPPNEYFEFQDSSILAGFRASRIISSYPNNQFPSPEYWVNVGDRIAQKFNNSSPASIWITGLYQGNGDTRVGCPFEGNNYSHILYADSDMSENYLTKFDQQGIKVYLQVEPGDANVDTLIKLILTRYGHHKCVIGFGIDVEWLNPDQFNNGRQVTDSEAAKWESEVKSFNNNYNFFLKHFWPDWMPPHYRGDIIFIDDGQQFISLNDMVNNFKNWADRFPSNKVGFQFGYPSDENWWNKSSDPPKEIGDAILSSIPNTFGLFWVDFSITQVFPVVTSTNSGYSSEINNFSLSQNYPNPFNPSTKINYNLPYSGYVKLEIFNVLGIRILQLVSGFQSPGEHNIIFNAANLPSGIYFYKLETNGRSIEKKMILLK